jgi:hypothetical protein
MHMLGPVLTALALLAVCGGQAVAAEREGATGKRDFSTRRPAQSTQVPTAEQKIAELEALGLGTHPMRGAAGSPSGSWSPAGMAPKPAPAVTVPPLSAPELAAALERQRQKMAALAVPRATPRPTTWVPVARGPRSPDIRTSIPLDSTERAADERRLREKLAAPIRTDPGVSAGPLPATRDERSRALPRKTEIPGTPLSDAQRAKLERAISGAGERK